MQVAEMRMLRWSLGITMKERVSNEEIRNIVKVGDIAEKMQET